MTRDTSDIEREVEVRRHEVERTLDALRAKLSTGEIVESVTRSVANAGNTGNEVAGTLGRQIKENPLPVVITGVGLALLIAGQAKPRAPQPADSPNRRDENPPSTRETVGEAPAAADAGEGAGTGAGSGDCPPGQQGTTTQDAAADLARDVRTGTQRAWRGVTGFVREQPFIAAALAIAVGTALGAAFPANGRRSSSADARPDQAEAASMPERSDDAETGDWEAS